MLLLADNSLLTHCMLSELHTFQNVAPVQIGKYIYNGPILVPLYWQLP